MNNARRWRFPEKTLTEDANELQMQTNHLSHFALTRELLPLMLETEKRYPERKPRVVNVASIAHEWGFVDFFNLNSEGVFGYPGWGGSRTGGRRWRTFCSRTSYKENCEK